MVGYCTVPGHVSVQNQIDYHCSYSAVSAWLRAVQFLDMCLHVYRTRSIIIVVTQPCLHGCVLYSSWTCVCVQNQIVFLSLYYSTSAVSSWLGAVQVPEHVSVYRTRWIIIVVTQLCLHGWLLFRFLDMCLCTEPDRLSL